MERTEQGEKYLTQQSLKERRGGGGEEGRGEKRREGKGRGGEGMNGLYPVCWWRPSSDSS